MSNMIFPACLHKFDNKSTFQKLISAVENAFKVKVI